MQLDAKRRDDTRQMTASLVSAIYSLLSRSGIEPGKYAIVRQDVFEKAMLFQMHTHPRLDAMEFTKLVKKLTAVADLRNNQVRDPGKIPKSHSTFAYIMVEGYVDCLLEFGRKDGGYQLVDALSSTVKNLGDLPDFQGDPLIQAALYPKLKNLSEPGPNR